MHPLYHAKASRVMSALSRLVGNFIIQVSLHESKKALANAFSTSFSSRNVSYVRPSSFLLFVVAIAVERGWVNVPQVEEE
jgi:hypothetical protein